MTPQTRGGDCHGDGLRQGRALAPTEEGRSEQSARAGTLVHVTAHLLNGISYVPGEFVSLDGPLLYAAVLERMGEDFHRSQPTKTELARETAEPDEGVPLVVHRTGGTWVYAVSGPEIDGHHGSTLTHWVTRLDDGLLVPAIQDGAVDMGRKTKVQINSAQYKAYRMPIYDELVERLTWTALSPDPERLAWLLGAHVHHVGKKRNTGHGAVVRWEVEEVDGAPDAWMHGRPLPVEMRPEWDGPVGLAPVRPPYWLIQHEERCALLEAPDA